MSAGRRDSILVQQMHHNQRLASDVYRPVVLSMVAVAQLVESRIVIPVVVGSSPISHPIYQHPKDGKIAILGMFSFRIIMPVVFQLRMSSTSSGAGSAD